MKPKYQALKETLIEQIRAGAFAEEFPIPSEAELSAKYSVSRNTVRQAMKELENEGYLYRARGKGTFIRNVSSLSSRKIALLLSDSRDLCHPVTMKMVSALSETLEQSGFLLDILASHRTFQEENLARLATNYAGFVLGTYRLDAMTVAELDKLAIPHLFVKSYLPGRDDPAVRIDFAKAGALAAQHLIECGCRTLGLVYPGRHIPPSPRNSTTESVPPRSKTALRSNANMFLKRKTMTEQKLKKPDSALRNWIPVRMASSPLRTTRRRPCWKFSTGAASEFRTTSCSPDATTPRNWQSSPSLR